MSKCENLHETLIPVAGIKFVSNRHYHYDISINHVYITWKLRIPSAKSHSWFLIVQKHHSQSPGHTFLGSCRNFVAKI